MAFPRVDCSLTNHLVLRPADSGRAPPHPFPERPPLAGVHELNPSGSDDPGAGPRVLPCGRRWDEVPGGEGPRSGASLANPPQPTSPIGYGFHRISVGFRFAGGVCRHPPRWAAVFTQFHTPFQRVPELSLSARLRGEREGPIAERWEGEVGCRRALWNPPPPPGTARRAGRPGAALSAPRGGEGELRRLACEHHHHPRIGSGAGSGPPPLRGRELTP
jgi:hypothetical protein